MTTSSTSSTSSAEGGEPIATAPQQRTPTLLTMAELERARLILRGGSVVDWFKLQLESADEVRGFVQLLGGDVDDAADQARLLHLRNEAAQYLGEELGYRIPDELLECAPIDLFLYASERRGRRRDRFFACLLLKVMHIVQHIEARELRYRLPLSDSRVAELLKGKVDAFAQGLLREGFPLVQYVGGEKTMSSLVTKLLVKKEHHAAAIHDRVRFRFVTESAHDLLELMALMTKRLFPFNYVAPGQAVNLLINFTALVESHPLYRRYADDLQLELGQEEKQREPLNEFSGPSYRVVSFIVDMPLRLPDDALAGHATTVGGVDLGRVIFGLAEFQLVDRATDEENARGENRHDRYRARQLRTVRDRLERGKRA